jgi:hypothetical protein
MYSPNRLVEPTIERNDLVAASPLRALTPIVDVIKNAQSNASRDFDRFYDNLWAKLTPRTSNVWLNCTYLVIVILISLFIISLALEKILL